MITAEMANKHAIQANSEPSRSGHPQMANGAVPAAMELQRGLPSQLGRIIRPEAQPRWLLPSLSLVTPQYLEAILRGALVGNHVMQWQLFDLMEDTWPRLVKNLNELKRAAISKIRNQWRIQPWTKRGEAPTPEAEDRAALIEEALFEMKGDAASDENGFDSTLYDLLDAWAKGTSIVEIDWEVRASQGDMGEIVAPRATYWVHPRNYAWGNDGRIGLVLGKQTGTSGYSRTDTQMPSPYFAGTSDFVPIPDDKFLVAICKARTGNPLGGAMLRPLAWWWCAANFSADWLLNFAQVFGLPVRWATYQAGASQQTIDAINGMLENMGSSAWASFPAGTALELKESTRTGEQLPQASVIDRADKQCDLLILGQTLTTQVQREGGARALGEVHERVRDEVVDAAASFGARTLNEQMVPAICRLNYGDDSMRPSFVPNNEDPESAKANAEVIQLAVQTGIPVPVRFALEKLNIPAAEEGEELVQAPAAAAAANGESRMANGAAENGLLPEGHQKAENEEETPAQAHRCGRLHAKNAPGDASDKLVDKMLEDLTGVEARWLGGVKPWFANLVLKAKSEQVTDADFVKALERARRELPELFHQLNAGALQEALENAMGAAVVNGGVRGSLRTATGRKQTPSGGAPASRNRRNGVVA